MICDHHYGWHVLGMLLRRSLVYPYAEYVDRREVVTSAFSANCEPLLHDLLQRKTRCCPFTAKCNKHVAVFLKWFEA